MKNLPNRITISRIVIIFIFVLLANCDNDLFDGAVTAYSLHVTAYILAIIAGVTDIIDGYLARKFNWVSDFGALMDPLADKIFIAATFIMMSSKGYISPWIPIIIISREFLVTGLRLLAVKKGEVISADGWGKLKTFLQMMALLIGGAYWINLIDISKFRLVWDISVWGVVIVTVASGFGYFVRHRHLYQDSA
jgi:CDP-diacylglycerol--glycerol-3-phosphate 3-phosphatidyltransferase